VVKVLIDYRFYPSKDYLIELCKRISLNIEHGASEQYCYRSFQQMFWSVSTKNACVPTYASVDTCKGPF